MEEVQKKFLSETEEKIVSERILHTKSFTELIEILSTIRNNGITHIQGSSVSFEIEFLINEIIYIKELSKKGHIPKDNITRSLGLRDKIEQLYLVETLYNKINTFEELYNYIRKLNYIPTNKGILKVEELIIRINLLREDKISIKDIPESFYIKQIVEKLNQKDKGGYIQKIFGKKTEEDFSNDEFYKLLKNINRTFIQSDNSSFNLSGWKLHIFGTNILDSFIINTALNNYLKKNNIVYKVGTNKFYQTLESTPKQYGKAFTIYLPIYLFHQKKIQTFIKEIQKLLKKANYNKDSKIYGDKKISTSIYYRYDLSIPMPFTGLEQNIYSNFYVENNNSQHNLSEEINPDLLEYE